MFSSAIIIFREVFEIVLIVGIIMAATRGLAGRGRWVAIGLGGGALGAGIVALFVESISALADGMGQELFNASILFVAAAFIGWTVLWMAKHSREMVAHMRKVGKDVSEGNLPMYSIAAVVGLALLREGSEIVLFTFGMLASGQSISSILGGAALGTIAGLIVGMLVYTGLVKLSTKHILQVTSWLLIFLVAGMASQGAKYLSAAGYFSDFSETVWDSSQIVSDEGFLGKTLGVLIGYSARPELIQLIFYSATLLVLVALVKLPQYKAFQTLKTRIAALFCLFSMFALILPSDAAAAGKQVYNPYVEKGELEVESKGNITDNDEINRATSLSVGYGFTDYWASELYVEVEHEKGQSWGLTEYEWENKFQLTEQGEYFFDVGALTEIAISQEDDHADEFSARLLLAHDQGKFLHLANIILSHELNEHARDGIEYGLALSTRYKLDKMFEPGLELHSNFGRFQDHESLDEQSHQFGPVIYGKLPHGFKYDVGYLFGLSEGAPDGEVKWIVEYEMRF
ncbi:MAG: hypothetical protein EB060_09315 [Proteobacteria bacterium]|nr:hypothetical protein [Pseudomonadota bacterium]